MGSWDGWLAYWGLGGGGGGVGEERSTGCGSSLTNGSRRGLPRNGRRAPRAADDLLRLGRVVADVHLGGGGGGARLLAGHLAHLVGLRVDDLRDLLDLAIDEGLVRGVDEGCDEEDRGADQAEAPEGDDLDEEVGDEGGDEGLGVLVHSPA